MATPHNQLSEIVHRKQTRKLKQRQRDDPSLWSHLGLFGVIGWAVSIPTVLGALLGWWLDSRWPQTFSWTLMLILLGLMAGCTIAWKWLQREHRRGED